MAYIRVPTVFEAWEASIEEGGIIEHDKLMEYRHKTLIDLMNKKNFDVLIAGSSANMHYMSGYQITTYPGWNFALLTKDGEMCAFFPRKCGLALNLYGVKAKLKTISHDTGSCAKILGDTLKEMGISEGRIGMCPGFKTDIYFRLREKFPKLKFLDASEVFETARMVKHKEEVKLLKEAIVRAEAGMYAALSTVELGKTERDVYVAAQVRMKELGAERNLKGGCWVASGRNTAILKRYHTDRMMRNGDLVIIDLGCTKGSMFAEFARTKIVGEPTEKQRNLFQTCQTALKEALDIMRSGVKASKIYKTMRDVITEAGYKKYMHDLLGHGIGLDKGPPYISEWGKDIKLKEGMILCIQPGISLYDEPHVGGAKIEDIVQIKEDRAIFLTKTSYDENLTT